MSKHSDAPLVFLVAGEPSGDMLGGRLMAALKEQTAGSIRFAGIGGERMTAEGLHSLFPMRELSVMGYLEVVRRIPHLLGRIRQTAGEARAKTTSATRAPGPTMWTPGKITAPAA